MGIFTRMSNMIKGKVNTALDEMENPVELLDQKLRDMDEQLNKAKLSSAQILGNAHEIEKKLIEAKKISEDYDKKVQLALDKGNSELAKTALAKKLENDKKVFSLQYSFDTANIQANSIKDGLRDLEEEIEKTRNYRDEAAARFTSAEAYQKVNEVLANVKTSSNSIQIDSIERTIQKKESLAQGLGELRNLDTFDSEFEKLEQPNLDDELAKYKVSKEEK